MMFSKVHLGAAAAIALTAGLAACNNPASGDGRLALTGSAYCTPFQKAGATPTNNQSGLAATPASTASDPGAAFDDCIHRWAYAMAPARDPADIVAHASVDACGAQMNAWNQQVMAQNTQDPNSQYEVPPMSRRGRESLQMDQQQQNPQQQALAQHMQIAEARSLFYVIQARAAGCAPPPANTLVSNPAT
jgi:hypothetical protein